jgi:serine/threonine protein kinase
MAKDIDSELATNVKAAKTKRMYFAFVAKGSSDGALVISKTKVPPVLITDAKKRSGGTQVFKGACFGEDGKLVFEMAKEPPATMEAALKKVVQRDAALTQVYVCRVGTNPELADDGPATDATSAVPPARAETAKASDPPAASLYSKYSAYQASLQPLLIQALKDKTPDTEKLKSVFGYARDQAANKDYAKAIQGLGALDALLKTHYTAYAASLETPTPAGGNSGAARPGAPVAAPSAATASAEALAQANLKPERIDSAWGRSIDLDKCKVKFNDNAPHGEFGKLGFIESSDPAAPPLVIKVPLKEQGAADLQKEVDFYKQVGEHPNFPKCLGIADVGGQRGMVMEAVNGKDMGKTMDKLKEQYAAGKISHEEYWGAVQHTVRQTLEAIVHLESVGVVHNDIRMDNIMCDEATGQMKVLDFGISVQAGQATATVPVGYGTVSPDVIARDERGVARSSQGAVTSKHDVFSVGAAGFAAGEKQMFDYGTYSGMGTFPALAKFGELDAAGNAQQAIKPADERNPAFVKDAQGNARHVAGRSGANTAYTDFINRLMDPDPRKRLSPADALKEPFLADSLMDEEAARGVFKKLLAPEAPGAKTTSGLAVTAATGSGPVPITPGTAASTSAYDGQYHAMS